MTIAYTPVDLPKVPYSEEEYWTFFNENNAEKEYWNMLWKNVPPDATQIWEFCPLRIAEYSDEEKFCVSGPGSACKFDDTREWQWKDSVKQKIPKFIDFVEALPLRSLTYVSLMSNIDLVVPHRDFYKYPWSDDGIDRYQKEAKGLEPVSYRIVLAGDRTGSFFMTPTESVDDAICIHLPEETDTFLFNATEYYHGAFATQPRKIVCLAWGFLDIEKHKELLNRSIEKYSDYIIYLDDDDVIPYKPEPVCITGHSTGDDDVGNLGTWPPVRGDS